MHTDLCSTGWIARLPSGLRAYALLARLDRPTGTWLLFTPCVWAIALAPHGDLRHRARLIVLFAIGSTVMRAAGCVINDMWDRDIDARVARTASRPLASGQLNLFQALIFLSLLLCAGLAILVQLPRLCWLLAPLALVLVALYPLAKRVTWWPQLIMGFTFGFGAPMGYAAQAQSFDLASLLLYGGTIMWQLGFDTIYGFQDIDDDARIGVRSTSRRWIQHPRLFVGGSYLCAAIFIAGAAYLAHLSLMFWLFYAIGVREMVHQVRALEITDPAMCLRLFKRNVSYGFLLAFGFLAGRFIVF